MKIISLILPFLVVFILSGCSVDTKQCTKEGKVCEDGTLLSREGINCEFPECPKSSMLKEVIEDEIILESDFDIETEPLLEPISIIKEFDIIAKKWDFEPAIITVNEGDVVRLKIKEPNLI